MDVTTASLLANQLQTLDPKAIAKENATKIIQDSADIPLSLSAQKSTTTPNNAQEVVGQLLSTAVSEAKSKSAIFEILQNNQLFKNMGNFAEDIKSLTSLIKLDSSITKPLALLQLFSRNIEQVDVKMLQEQIKNSGIFFESKLANIVTQKGVAETIQTLTLELKEHFSSTSTAVSPIVKEITVIMDRLNTLQELSSKEAQTSLKSLLDLFRQSIKKELTSETIPMFKEVYQMVQKLDYAIEQMDLINSKIDNYPPIMKVEEHFTTQVKVLLEQIKENLSTLQLDDLQPKIDQLLTKETLLKQGNTTTPLLTNDPLESVTNEVKKEIVHSPTQSLLKNDNSIDETHLLNKEAIKAPEQSISPTSLATALSSNTNFQKSSETVEEALKMVVNRLKQQIEILDTKTIQQANFVDKSAILEQKIHSLIKPELFVGKAMTQKLSLDPTDVELLSDMKGVLTKLNDSLAPTPQNREALEITNRLLTQIEYHQLFSYVSSSTHLYIPFSWDGLNGGSMMMKQTSDEKFHCQIDLDLEQYGKLNMMLLLSGEKYIDISIAAQKKRVRRKNYTTIS